MLIIKFTAHGQAYWLPMVLKGILENVLENSFQKQFMIIFEIKVCLKAFKHNVFFNILESDFYF